jgi:hypothetical protein
VAKAAASLGGEDHNRLLSEWMADVLEGAPATRVPFAEGART